MIRSVTEGKLESKQKELLEVEKDLARLNNLIQNLEQQKNIKLKERSDLYYEISELKDELEELEEL